MRPIAICLALLGSAFPLAAQAQSAEESAPERAEPSFSLSLERVASANAIFLSVDDGDEKLRSKGVTVGGPIANPLSAPRLAVDYLTKSGLTVGAGLALAFGDLDSKGGSGGFRDEGGYNLVMLAPRVGYRIEVADWLDVTPRAGAALGWASIQSGEYESCDYDFESDEEYNCSKDSDTISMLAAVANLEVAAAFRLTDSFNILAGVSYDMLVAARAKDRPSHGSDDSESHKASDGHFGSLQLWLGLGGYL